jgi:hypothetical protein
MIMANEVDETGALPVDEGDEGGGGDEGSFLLSTIDRRFLAKAAGFLVGAQTPSRAKVLRKAGYTPQEHALGWALYATAAGQGRPFDHYVDEAGEGTEAQAKRLRELDAFENLWFPRTKAIILRVAPPEERARFVSAFFTNLAQQPLGPLVVVSVAIFLTRVDGLSSSTFKGAAEVREILRQRGLTDAEIARVRSLLDQARGLGIDTPARTSSARLEAGGKQRRALEDLHAWLRDWSTTLRPLLSPRDRVALGLSARKRGGGDDEGEEGEGDAAE